MHCIRHVRQVCQRVGRVLAALFEIFRRLYHLGNSWFRSTREVLGDSLGWDTGTTKTLWIGSDRSLDDDLVASEGAVRHDGLRSPAPPETWAMDMGKPIQQPEKLIISMVIGGLPIASIPRCVPETWVTDYSGDIGNTLGPKGLATGSSLHVSSMENSGTGRHLFPVQDAGDELETLVHGFTRLPRHFALPAKGPIV